MTSVASCPRKLKQSKFQQGQRRSCPGPTPTEELLPAVTGWGERTLFFGEVVTGRFPVFQGLAMLPDSHEQHWVDLVGHTHKGQDMELERRTCLE